MVQQWDPDYGLNLIRLEGDRVSRCGAQLTHSAGRWVGARVDDSAWEEFGVGENNRTGRYSGSIFSRARIGRLHYNYTLHQNDVTRIVDEISSFLNYSVIKCATRVCKNLRHHLLTNSRV